MSVCVEPCWTGSFSFSLADELWWLALLFGFSVDNFCFFSSVLSSESRSALCWATRREKVVPKVLLVGLCHYVSHVAHVHEIAELVLIHELDNLDLHDSPWWVAVFVCVGAPHFEVLCLLLGPEIERTLLRLLSWAQFFLLRLDLESDKDIRQA